MGSTILLFHTFICSYCLNKLINLVIIFKSFKFQNMLKQLKVLQFQGLAPSVFCGMYFADQGADVILIARPQPAPFSMDIHKNIMNRRKRCIKLSLKNSQDREILVRLIKQVDIIIDPYRPGVLQRQKLGPKDLYKINPKIILLRVSGYGQTGEMALKPGHDLNYISSSGILKLINQSSKTFQFPANYLADFVSASLGIKGTLNALINRKVTGKGSVVDCSLAGGCSYLTYLFQQIKDLKNDQKIKQYIYFEMNQKRYVITQKQDIQAISTDQITRIINQMQQNNQTFYKNEKLQIAQINKISRIKNSSLKNPFNLLAKQNMIDKIPQRDENRTQILKDYNIPNPKL